MIVKIFESVDKDRFIYLIPVEKLNDAFYAIILQHPGSKHWCGYLNLSRSVWNKITSENEDFRWREDITFEGIDSVNLTIPVELNRSIPIIVRNYWIGIDYMGRNEQPGHPEILARLETILNLIEDHYRAG